MEFEENLVEDMPLCFDNIIKIWQFSQNTTSDIYLLKWATSFGMFYHHQTPLFLQTL
jgi:hypothetical protein